VKYLKFIILFFSITLLWQDIAFAGDVHVRGHYRKDGTYVRPHMRSSPDGNVFNNWSTKGNVNPYTGKTGTKDPYKLLEKKGGVSAYPPNLNQIPPSKKNNQEFQVPNNAYVSGNNWFCNEGYQRSRGQCLALKVPKNAYVSGNNWFCNEGYQRSRGQCLALKVPKNAYVSGNNWFCNEGYQRSRGQCLALKVPKNAYVSGNNWFCNSGFKRNGNKCNVASNDKSLAGSINSPKAAIPSYSYSGGGYSSYDYDVSGYDSEGNYVYGDANADGSRDVDGYIYSEDGDSKSFSGEWVGKGEIEGYDEDGNYLSLEVD